jgi:hypothetical protein
MVIGWVASLAFLGGETIQGPFKFAKLFACLGPFVVGRKERFGISPLSGYCFCAFKAVNLGHENDAMAFDNL